MGIEERSRKLFPPNVPIEMEIPEWRVEDMLRMAADKYPDHPAVVFYERTWTYADLWHDVERLAHALRTHGLKEQDRVALMLPNCPQYVISYYAILLAGGIVTQVNPMLVEREIMDLLRDSQSTMIIALDVLLPRIINIRAMSSLNVVIGVNFSGNVLLEGVEDFNDILVSESGDDLRTERPSYHEVAVLQYTGGTTGRSKGAMLTHRNLVANVLQCYAFQQDWIHLGEERALAVIPFFHVYGMTVALNLTVYCGGTLVLFPRFDIHEVLGAIETHHITLFPGVPTMYVGLLNAPDLDSHGVDSIRICNSGSAPMPVERMKMFEERTGATILEGYGLSEASPVTHSSPIWGIRKPGTVGIALPSTECQIIDPTTGQEVEIGGLGELLIRGPQVMLGYWNQPDETDRTLQNGWLHTGDVASYDEEGYITIMDRLKDVIIASGFNVYPREIEEVLYQHPDIQEAVVVGAPDEYRGETVRAVVVKKAESTMTEEQLLLYLKSNLSAYKVPKIIEFQEALPKSAVGKILRRVVRDGA